MAVRERALGAHAVELPEPWRSAAVTVVLPTYNEATNLPVIVEQILGLPLSGLKILVADDNSPDGTGKVADELVEKYGYKATGGSDSHLVSLIGLCATRFEADIKTIDDLVRELKTGNYEAVDFRPKRKPVPHAVPAEAS